MADILEPEKVSEKISKGAFVVDVRTPDEFRGGHLENAQNIPVTEIEQHLASFGTDKNREIIVYCQRGARAGKAKEALEKNGFTNVHNAGGYPELRKAGI